MEDIEMGRTRRKTRRKRTRKRGKTWGKAVRLGEHVEIRTQAPYRAAVMELQPGLYVVGELKADALDFGASTKAVTREILRAVDKGLDTVFPKRRAKKARANAEVRQIRDSDRRERELRQREAKLRETEDKLRRLEAKKRRTALKREAAPWLVDDDDWDSYLAGDGDSPKLEEPNTLAYIMWKLNQYEE